MIYRYYTLCPGCGAKTVLRLQIGVDEYQPFFYVCTKCGAPSRGSISIDYESVPLWADLQLDDGDILDYDESKEPDQTITIALDLPCMIFGDNNPASQFPFIYQTSLMGDFENVIRFKRSINMFRGMIKNDWQRLRRLITYYIDRNWQQFADEWERIFSNSNWSVPKNDFERHDQMHRALEMFFLSILPEKDYPILKNELNEVFSKLVSEKPEIFNSYLLHFVTEDEISQYQRDLMERLGFVVNNFSALSPGFPLFFYKAKTDDELNSIRIMRDDLELLKGHYLSCFEILHDVLDILVGLVNIAIRDDPNAFADGKPTSLEIYSRKPNAHKPKYIDSDIFPELTSRWKDYFDRNIRNSVGHYGIYHDLKTGLVILDDGTEIPYSKFVANTLNLTTTLLYGLQVVKMVYIFQLFREHDEAS